MLFARVVIKFLISFCIRESALIAKMGTGS
jgi:hypothetical protein